MIAQNTTAAARRDEDPDVQPLQRAGCPRTPADAVVGDRVGDRVAERVLALQRTALLEEYAASQIAIQLSMIVEITSWAPTAAFSQPAIPAHAAPISAASDDRDDDVEHRVMP